MKTYLIAGEESGDLHGGNLMRELQSINPNTNFRFWGGDHMKEYGGEPVVHQREINFMGFWEVIKNIRKISKLLKLCKEDIKKFKPDALILIDYPGFNMRIGKFAAELGIPVFWYISPQVWAWKAGRVKKLKKFCTKMFVILPFEKSFFKTKGMDVEYVGHPLLDELKKFSKEERFIEDQNLNPDKKIVALLPGSRKQEIKKKLPLMAKMAEAYPEYQFVIAGLSHYSDDYYRLVAECSLPIVKDKTYQLLAHSHAALVTSGTATLETGLFKVPQVVCYKGNPISYSIGKRLVNIKFISLVNLILDKPALTELIQGDFNQQKLHEELGYILEGEQRTKMKESYEQLTNVLGKGGASKEVAESIVKCLGS